MRLFSFAILTLTLFWLLPTSTQASNSFYARINALNAADYYLIPLRQPLDSLFSAAETSLTENHAEKEVRFVVNLPPRQLTIFEDQSPTRKYPVTIGRTRYKTPIGPRSLSKLIWNPWWYPPDSEWAKDANDTPPGPRNPLGKVKIPLGGPILLHGTSKPWSIGRAASHACMRMHNRDIIEIATWLQSEFSNHAEDPLALKHRESWFYRSYEVPLNRTIPLEIVYQTVEVDGDDIVLYPDVYKRLHDYSDDLIVALATIGIPAEDIDFDRLPKVLPIKESIRIPILNILQHTKLLGKCEKVDKNRPC